MKKWGIALWQFLKKHRWSVLLVTLSIIVAAFFIWDSFSANSGSDPIMGKLRPKPIKTVAAPLSGLQVLPDVTQKRVTAVVVENHPDARPQSGLNQADVVYETFAEGGITRFLALYQSQEPKEIGPVRSARVYFVEWASSYRALFAHVGGNVDAIGMIPSSSLYDINQFYNGQYFWRDNARYAPHNVYTTLPKLFQAATARKYPLTDTAVPKFSFKKDLEEAKRPATSKFTVNFNYSFAVTWTYITKDNAYLRSMSGVAQKDRNTLEQLKAKNIMVAFSEFSYGTTKAGEQVVRIRTTGSGTAVYFQDGQRYSGTWKRPTKSDVTRFYDSTGSEVKLNPGTTWIEFAPVGTEVK
jgi:hypothetical protein